MPYGPRPKITARELKEAQQSAREILASPHFFALYLEALKRQGLVGEEKAALVVLIVIVSRLLKRPINLMVKGQSSSGKNFLVRKSLSLLPKDAVREITSTSQRAWNYAADAFCHRVVLIQELNESSGTAHPIRLLMSEGQLVRLVTQRVGADWITRRYVVKGPIASISTTTRNVLEIDDETRHLSLWVDESVEQTDRVVHAYGFERPLTRQERLTWRMVHRLLEKKIGHNIQLPAWFSKVADGLYKHDLRVRRYYPAFVEACRTVALIRSFQRTHQTTSTGKLCVDFADFAIAASIFDEVYVESLHRDEGPATETRKVVERLTALRNGKPVHARDLATELSISIEKAYERLRDAVEAGTLERANRPEKDNVKLYCPAPRPRFVPDPEALFATLSADEVPNSIKFVDPITDKVVVYARKKSA